MIRDKNIFLVGVGGIGLSALGRVLLAHGNQVSGSDSDDSELLEDLKKEGIAASIGHDPDNISADIDLLVHSNAIPENNPERLQAKKLGIKQLSYPEALAEAVKNYFVIAVAGTNGKTTTTGMIASVMEEAGLDPTVIVGSKMKSWNSNARVGKSKYFLIEADEYKRAFLNYKSDLAVITNIALDHLDYYKDEKDVRSAFTEFKKLARTVVTANSSETFELQLPGEYNQENARAAAAVCRELNISQDAIKRGLKNFQGTWRRFEKLGRVGEADVISDYAHHPEGVKALLKTVSKIYKRPLFVYQPHQHNRTKMLFDDFVKAFCESDVQDLIFVEIFDVEGRERDADQGISSKDLVKAVQKCGKKSQYAKDLNEAQQIIQAMTQGHDAVFIVGAGDIYSVAERLVKKSN